MMDHAIMVEQAKEAGTFSNIPINKPPLIARLKPHISTKSLWPNPEQSVGKHCWTSREHKFWDITGPAQTQLAPLITEAISLLHTHNEYLKEREAATMFLDLFMVGVSGEKSCPTLIIICAQPKPCQRVVEIIRSSKILDKYPGVRLGISSKHPRNPRAGSPQSIASGDEKAISQNSTIPEIRVYVKKSDRQVICGTLIYIPLDEYAPEGLRRFRKATIGGFLSIKSKDGTITTVGMTVAHAFKGLRREDLSSDSRGSNAAEFEFEFIGQNSEEYWSDDDHNNKLPFSGKKSSWITLYDN